MSVSIPTAPFIVSVFLDQPILAVIYLITLGVAAWVVRDGLRRNISVFIALGWAVGVLIVPPIALFAYLYRRRKTEGEMADPPLGGSD